MIYWTFLNPMQPDDLEPYDDHSNKISLCIAVTVNRVTSICRRNLSEWASGLLAALLLFSGLFHAAASSVNNSLRI